MASETAYLVSLLGICIGLLYAAPIIYEDVSNTVIGQEVGFNHGKAASTCEECKSGDCDLATVNGLCYENFDSDIIPSKKKNRVRRDAINTRDWPKSEDGLIYIPYSFNNQIIEAKLQTLLKNAEREFEKHTCFRLKRRTNEENYVSIIEYQGCWSYMGKQGGKQYLSLAPWCLQLNTVLHEFLHVVGFLHEMSRLDRDKHIRINWANVDPKFITQFHKTPYGGAFAHGKDYDVNSVMHYGNKMAAINRNVDTMTSVKSPGAMLGVIQGASFSEGDKMMIKLKGFCNMGIKMHSGPYADSNNVL